MPPAASTSQPAARRAASDGSQSTVDPAFSHAGTSLTPIGDHHVASESTRALAARIPRLRDPTDTSRLTPLRAHYLKKTLLKLQIENEIAQLSEKEILSTFGPPFRPSAQTSRTDLPVLRFIFHHFFLTFPFLRSAPPNFFSDKVQVFYDRFLERNISGTDDRMEESKRRKMGARLTKWITLLMGAAIHVKGGHGAEEVLRIAEEDRERMVAAQARMKATLAGAPIDPGHGAAAFDVNVVGVRVVHSKRGRLGRTRAREEFLIRTRRAGQPDVFVSRRYGDFNRLADTLRVEFPDEDVGRPPAKDRREVGLTGDPWRGNAPPGHDAQGAGASSVGQQPSALDMLDVEGLNLVGTEYPSGEANSQRRPPLPRQRTLSAGAANSAARSAAHAASTTDGRTARPRAGTTSSAPGSPSSQRSTLVREKNRLTLRAYLRGLLSIQQVADSAALSSFLLGDPIVLTQAEEADVAAREALDAVREDEAARFATEASRRVDELRGHISAFKAELVQEDGLSRVFATIRQTPNIDDLPESYRALLAWGRISAASTLFHLFMGSDTSSNLFSQLKRMHGLMPYFVLRQILRISNPVSMIRGVLDVFLAQPFGQRSLLQRMFAGGLQEEVRELGEMLEKVRAKVEDDALCEKVRCFVYAPAEQQKALRREAEEERLDLVTVILRAPDLAGAPSLGRSQVHRVVKASRAYEVYKEYRENLRKGEEDEGPGAVDEDAWLYEDLHVYLRCLTRLRDKEQMISLVFEGVTSELLKDIVTIFYSPLAQVYKAANIADSLSDMQAFINDLIRTVEASEELSYTDPQRTVQVFIDLVQRHEARFYAFVHSVHSKGEGLFNGLMHWIELFINFVRGPDEDAGAEGLHNDDGHSSAPAATDAQRTRKPKRRGIGVIDLEICMPAGGEERRRALEEIDAVVVHAYRLKMVRDLKLRRRLVNKEVQGAAAKLLKTEGGAEGGGERGSSAFGAVDDDHAFVSAMMDNLGVASALTGEIEDVEAEELEEDEEEEEEGEEDGYGQDHASHTDGRGRAARPGDAASEDDDEDDASTISGSRASVEVGPSGGDKLHGEAASPPPARWMPPPPGRSMSQLTVQPDKALPSVPAGERGVATLPSGPTARSAARRNRAPQPPKLEVLPTMVPFFVEMIRGRLRPARSASASSTTSLPGSGARSAQAAPHARGLPPVHTEGVNLSALASGTATVALPVDVHPSPASYRPRAAVGYEPRRPARATAAERASSGAGSDGRLPGAWSG